MTRFNRIRFIAKIVALPATIVFGVFNAVWSSRNALRSHIRCRHCDAAIILIRAWRCSCGFTYLGSVLEKCRMCGRRPALVRCQECGLTWPVQ